MTPNQYLEWLDSQIEDNDRRMDDAGQPRRESYYLGCATAMSKAKEKFLTIEYPQQETQTENNFTDGLD
jgi:hypothetical protein